MHMNDEGGAVWKKNRGMALLLKTKSAALRMNQ